MLGMGMGQGQGQGRGRGRGRGGCGSRGCGAKYTRGVIEERYRGRGQDVEGDTALHIASFKGLINVLRYLLDKGGANPLAVNKFGVVPLDILPPKVRYLMEPYIPKMEMQVGQQYVALVIGSAGSVMHSIEAQCGVRLVVDESINHNCTITIMGPDDARNKARLSILEIVDVIT
ncbi:hypothetical protein Pelo_6286 [Pelomyxa schiedti]|nr:hypothetical protein Pelo_6286 [Pelomyxa schiedti]